MKIFLTVFILLSQIQIALSNEIAPSAVKIDIETENVSSKKALEIVFFYSKSHARNFNSYVILKLNEEGKKECLSFYNDESKCSSEYILYANNRKSGCDGFAHYVKENCAIDGRCDYIFYDDKSPDVCD